MRIGRGLRLAAQRDVSENVSFTLRRNTLGKVMMADLVGLNMFPPMLGDLFTAMGSAPEMRIAIGGATGAGKTTLSRAILNEQPPERRIVIIEDTAELDLFDEALHPNVESWEQREPNSEGEGAVTVGELVKHGLRNRPDLLIVGEVRGADAAIPMLEAMTHGQASLTTVHADDALGVLRKLALFLGKGADAMSRESAHDNLSQALDFVIHVDRGRDGGRFVSEVIEVAGFDGTQVTTNTIYQFDHDGGERAMHRMSESHVRKLRRVGFDPDRLGSAWR
jgi:Flp pilus assembly CpaF family ATPase